MFQRTGAAAYRADLGNTLALMKALRNPEKNLRCIHVAGTNGKGSTSHMLASILQECGYKTGLYTSPHLKDFRERIRINGEMIPREKVIAFVENNRPAFEEMGLSFFEWTVGLAFEHFRLSDCDINVIEVGMGGRLDATNVILPQLSVITNIGLDHTQFLGDTLEKIAAEKAGIIKSGVPVLIGETQSETQLVFRQKAAEKQAPIWFAEDLKPKTLKYELSLYGSYQSKNLITVLAAINLLRNQGFDIPEPALRKGLIKVQENTGLMGRWQILNENPLAIADTAHNAEGIKYVMAQLEQTPHHQLHVVWGMVADKDRNSIYPLLPKKAFWYFCKPDIPRGLSPETLMQEAALAGLKGRIYTSVGAAYQAALSAANPQDVIFVGGSTFVVAEVV
jgi:dihydrofolate synthase/folylpolyglutamate synthase